MPYSDETINNFTEREALNILTGVRGFKRIADTNAHAAGSGSHTDVAEFVGIFVVGAATFATGNVAASGDAPANLDALSAGDFIRCRLTTIKLSAGTIYAYYI